MKGFKEYLEEGNKYTSDNIIDIINQYLDGLQKGTSLKRVKKLKDKIEKNDLYINWYDDNIRDKPYSSAKDKLWDKTDKDIIEFRDYLINKKNYQNKIKEIMK